MSVSRIAVIIASAGRPQLLSELLLDLTQQTNQNFILVVSVPNDESLPPEGLPARAKVAYGVGLSAQRNAGLSIVPDATHVFCFDDDAVVRRDYIERALTFFESHPEVVALTGRVLLDGASGSAIPRQAAVQAVVDSSRIESEHPADGWRFSKELYGCNFAFRPPMLGGQQFDARLPLYSWLEDLDFCRRALKHGPVAKVDGCVIVHRGVKSGGRVAHRRLGYAQVMNPAYLWHAGSFPASLAFNAAVKRVLKNAAMSASPRDGSWRRARLYGNAVALRHVLRREFNPEAMLELPPDR